MAMDLGWLVRPAPKVDLRLDVLQLSRQSLAQGMDKVVQLEQSLLSSHLTWCVLQLNRNKSFQSRESNGSRFVLKDHQ